MSDSSESRSSRNARKKAVLFDSPRRRRFPVVPVTAAVLLCAAAAFFFLRTGNEGNSPTAGSLPDAPAGWVEYPVSLFADGKARHFTYTQGDIPIRYFLLRSGDGVIRAAFDACDVCWHADKGYFQEGEAMVCRNCGRRFAADKINEVAGGCNPAPLTREMAGDRVRIAVKDIAAGKTYFDFSGGGKS